MAIAHLCRAFSTTGAIGGLKLAPANIDVKPRLIAIDFTYRLSYEPACAGGCRRRRPDLTDNA
jgi:hypothetical protein